MKKWTMVLCAGLMIFTTSALEAKPNNPNKQHKKAWIAQHKAQKQQEKMQKEQYKALRKQQKQANGVYDDDYQYGNQGKNQFPQNQGKSQYPQNTGKRQQPQQNQGGWSLGDILGGIGI
ncbi:MAG: hypothetical protein K0R82_191 [Flavipsychrobacter sp.]|jgi:outer membrane biosynthesis protein TonB|nr:hypothetical protein [Flavipsychrobacter sp.]